MRHSRVHILLLALCLPGCKEEKVQPSAQTQNLNTLPVGGSSCGAARSAGALAERAREALGSERMGAHLAPPLPTRWPPAGGGIEYIVYRAEALPTGRIAYRLKGPSARVRFASPGAEPTLEPLSPEVVLGVEDGMGGDVTEAERARQERAEQALVEVVAGCRSVEEARAELKAYLDWLHRNPILARDFEQRGGEFLVWLRSR